MSQLYGRDRDTQKTSAIIMQADCRLLTILGMGGIGKTRLLEELVISLSDHFIDGVVQVDLQTVDNHIHVLPKILEALNVELSDHADQESELIARLANKNMVIALDNFEHVLDAAKHIKFILENVPSIKMIITSREALRIQDEHIYTLSGLSTPHINASTSEIINYSAIQLFMDRARQVRHDVKLDLDSIAEICRLVDGVPLAIELAAIWAKVLEADEILKEVQYCIDFLETDLRDIPERHRSIRAVFAGSWEQLTQKEQMTLAQLSVFKGSFERVAAMAITEATLKTFLDLRDKSLLIVTPSGFYRLHDLVRQLAFEKLQEMDQLFTQTRKNHATYYAQQTTQFADLLRGKEQKGALQQMSEQIHNIRSGLLWAKENRKPHLIQQYLLGIALYFQMKGSRTQEGVDLLTFDEGVFITLPANLQGQIQLLRGWMLIILWQNQDGVDAVWDAIQHIEQMPLWLGMALIPAINQPELLADRYQAIIQLIETQLEQAHDAWQRAWLLKAIGEAYFVNQQYEIASDKFQQSADCFVQIGDSWGATWAYGNLGRSLVQLGQFQAADEIYQRSIQICRELGHSNGWVDVINKQAELALHQGDYAQTRTIILHGLRVALEHHALIGTLTYLLHTLAKLHVALQNHENALRYLSLLRHHFVVKRGWREPEIADLQAQLDSLAAQSNLPVPEAPNNVDLVRLTESILSDMDASDVLSPIHSEHIIEPLTEREAQILLLIIAGLSNKEIADELIVAVGTVKTHAHNLYGKLGVRNRTEATAKALELNLV